MLTLNHPRIPNVTVDVPEQDVASWEASGWVNTGPAPKPTPEPDEGDEGATDEAAEPPKRKRRRK